MNETAQTTGQVEKHEFQAEVAKLLHLMVHSVYSEKEIFLRELISNASDACEKLRYAALTAPDLIADDPDFKITITIDAAQRTLVVSDNGIGMNREDLVENLGTIAHSGASAFVERMAGEGAGDVSLIGQFGVGFYSAFMVAERIEVISRRAGEAEAWQWVSDGAGAFTVAPAERAGRGTTITLFLRQGEDEWLKPERLRHIVKTYSDHIAVPISIIEVKPDARDEEEAINAGQALWTRPKSEITSEQYTEFYRHVGHAFDEPWHTLHYRAEGVIEYTVLLFIPGMRPMDLFDPARKPRLKLYVKRVFITDDCEDVLPGYLRFVRGVIDSEDLPLNISREMLQHNPVLAKIRKAVTGRILGELEKRAEKDAEGYTAFWKNFGAVLKEGIYEDGERRQTLLKLARFSSTAGDELISLADYVSRMKEGQRAIYYITGEDLDQIRRSPHLEGFAARGLEVLLLVDPVDDFWLQVAGEFEGKPLASVTRSGGDLADLELPGEKDKKQDDQPAKAELGSLVALLKQNLGDQVKDVRPSHRLTDSPVCLVADEGDPDMHLERLMRQHQQLKTAVARVLEINPNHRLIKKLAALATTEGSVARLKDMSALLLDQARIIEGDPLPDPAAFSRRLAAVMLQDLQQAGAKKEKPKKKSPKKTD
jgi:molecular chaperone HtpG